MSATKIDLNLILGGDGNEIRFTKLSPPPFFYPDNSFFENYIMPHEAVQFRSQLYLNSRNKTELTPSFDWAQPSCTFEPFFIAALTLSE